VIALSLNEVETLSTKAARGAGFSWGLAEDIGRAARRIAVEDDNWGVAMLSLAENAQSFAAPDPARAARWRKGEADKPAEGPLCPIRTAALLLDDPLPASVLPADPAPTTMMSHRSRANAFTWRDVPLSGIPRGYAAGDADCCR